MQKGVLCAFYKFTREHKNMHGPPVKTNLKNRILTGCNFAMKQAIFNVRIALDNSDSNLLNGYYYVILGLGCIRPFVHVILWCFWFSKTPHCNFINIYIKKCTSVSDCNGTSFMCISGETKKLLMF